jgi:ubiquinone biosynthesis protein UbiJ
MAVEEKSGLAKAQTELDPREDLTPYLGEWVALRNGKVVASEKKALELRAHPEVEDGDVLMPVSPSRSGYFVA